MPTVSVVIPTYNRAHCICDTVDSVLAQTFADLEVIVVDDGSTDNTREVLEERYGDRIVYIYQDNQERSAARNTGIRHSKGECVAFLDSDDIWLPDKLQAQMEVANRYPEVGLLYGRVFPIDSRGQWHLRETEMSGWGKAIPGRMFDRLIMLPVIPTPTVIVRRTCLDRVGFFDESFSSFADWDLWLRVCLHYDVAFVPQALAGKTVYDDIPSQLAAYFAQMSPVRVVERAFSGLPQQMNHLARLKPLALARHVLCVACLDYVLNRIPQARASLARAMSLDAAWLCHTDRFLRSIVDHGFRYAGPWGTCEDVFPFIDTVFSNLPPVAERYTRTKSNARARVYIVDAFRGYEAGDLSRARANILRGVLGDPFWLTNRGVISILLKSLLGKKAIEQLRGSETRATVQQSGLEWLTDQ